VIPPWPKPTVTERMTRTLLLLGGKRRKGLVAEVEESCGVRHRSPHSRRIYVLSYQLKFSSLSYSHQPLRQHHVLPYVSGRLGVHCSHLVYYFDMPELAINLSFVADHPSVTSKQFVDE
jgi:hypothetical protein